MCWLSKMLMVCGVLMVGDWGVLVSDWVILVVMLWMVVMMVLMIWATIDCVDFIVLGSLF